MRAGAPVRAAVLLLAALLLGAGALVVADRVGDGRAWAAAERYLHRAEGVRAMMGPTYEVVRASGVVMGGQLATWRGEVRGGGKVRPVTVVLMRTGDSWGIREARIQEFGEWHELVVGRDRLGGAAPARSP